MKNISIILFMLIIIGCATHQTPYVAYKDGNHSYSDTSVFIAVDDTHNFSSHNALTNVCEVDGVSLNCSVFWVRVKPGTHDFVVSYASNFTGQSKKEARIALKVESMQAGHVYVARWSRAGDTIKAKVEDLGKEPNYGIRLGGMYGDPNVLYKAKFDNTK